MKTIRVVSAALLAAVLLVCPGCAETETAPTPPATGDFARQYAAANGIQSYVDCDGTLYTWGFDSYNANADAAYHTQLGQGKDVLYTNLPTPIARNIVSETNLNFAVNDSGQLLRWGDTPAGYLETPQPVMENIREYHSLRYLTRDGKLYACYERARTGQNPPYGQETTLLMKDVADDCICGQTYLALKTDGTLWEYDFVSYLTLEITQKPTQILSGINKIVSSAAGSTALILAEDGTLYSMGDNEFGQCGNGEHGDLSRKSYYDCCVSEPFAVMENVADAWVDALGICFALTADGALYGWGLNDYDVLLAGDEPTSPMSGSRSFRDLPAKILDRVKTFYPNGSRFYAIREDASLWSWGVGNSGCLGNGKYTDNTDMTYSDLIDAATRNPILCGPQKILDDVTRMFGVETGGTLVFAEKKDGSVWYWGIDEIITDADGDWDTYNQTYNYYSRHEIIATPQPFDISTFHQGLGSKSK